MLVERTAALASFGGKLFVAYSARRSSRIVVATKVANRMRFDNFDQLEGVAIEGPNLTVHGSNLYLTWVDLQRQINILPYR